MIHTTPGLNPEFFFIKLCAKRFIVRKPSCALRYRHRNRYRNLKVF